MAIKLPVASFKTTLTARIEATATTIYLDSVLDDAGNAISGVKGFLIDEGTADEETVIGTVSGSTLVTCLRGISPTDGISEVTALKKAHRKNATIKITSHPYLLEVIRALNGITQFDADNIMAYDAAPAFTPGSNQLATVKYADDLALSGSPDSSETTKGIVEAATSAEVAAGDDSGSTTAPTFVRPSKLAEVIQKGSYIYAVEDGSGSDDAYVGALTPAITAYTAGAIYVIKLTVANTGACTLDLGGGAVAMKKWVAGALTDLETNDIAANYTGIFEYDGTYFVLLATSAGQLTQAQITTLITNSAFFTAPYNQPIRRSVTAAEDLLAGEVVALTSSGAVLSNPTGWDSAGTVVKTADDLTGEAMEMIAGVTNGASSYAVIVGTGVTNIRIWRVQYSATTGAVAALTVKDLSEGDAGSNTTWMTNRGTQLASDKILVTYAFGSATYTIRGKIYTPSSDAEGTELLIVTPGSTMGRLHAIMPVSSSEVVILYTDSVGIKWIRVTISGTTLTGGASGTLLTNANLEGVISACQFGSSGYYLVTYFNSSTSRVNYVICAYAAGVFSSISSEVELSSTTTTAQVGAVRLESLSDTKMLCTARLGTSTTGFIFTRSGTTVSVDGGTTIIASNDSDEAVGFAKLGEKTFVALANPSGSSQYTIAQLFKVKNSNAAIETIGSSVNLDGLSTSRASQTGCALKILPNMVLVAYPLYEAATSKLAIVPYTLTTNYEQVIGVVESDTTSGNSAPIIVGGATDEMSGLTSGSAHYTDMSGDVTTTSTGFATNAIRRVVIADSTTSGIVK